MEARAAIRAFFDDRTTRAELGGLARSLQLDSDPTEARAVSVLVRLDVGTPVDTLVASVLGQTHRPREVVVGVPPGAAAEVSRALAELEGAGLAVAAVERPPQPDPLIATATSPWITLWSPARTYGPAFLKDLLIGAECSRAPVVGYTGKADQEFVGELSPDAALVDRALAVDRELTTDPAGTSTGLGAWARAGVPLYGLAEADR